MKVRRQRWQFLFLAVLFILGGSMMSSFFAQAAGGDSVSKKITKKNQNFTVSAEYGIDGYVEYDNYALVRVTVKSTENFTGTVRVIPVVEDNSQKVIAYGEDIALAAGEEKTFSFVLAMNSSSQVKIEIMNENNKIVYGETDTLAMSYGDNVLVGILSDDYSALNYFDALQEITDYETISNILELSLDNFQSSSSALSLLQYIIIDNFDTAAFTEDQYTILKDWVNNGGVLILGLGANYQNVLHVFSDDFITGTLGTLEKKNLKWNFEESEEKETQNNSLQLSEKTQEKENEADTTEEGQGESGIKGQEVEEQESQKDVLSLAEVDVIPFDMKDAEEMADFSDDQTVFRKNIGAGAVVVISYALGMEPVASYANRQDMAAVLLREAATEKTFEENFRQYRYYAPNNIYNMAESADGGKRPNILLYAALLFFYVILVGPVLYLVLKTVKRREKIWVAIPVVALFFTFCIYLTGFLYRIRNPLVSTFSVVTLEDSFMSEEVFTSVTCPKAKDYTISLEKEYTGFQSNPYIYFDNLFANRKEKDDDAYFDYMVKKGNNGIEVFLHGQKVFDKYNFKVTRIGENKLGSIECDLHYYTNGFDGTITNQTNCDLTNVVINFENHYYQVGDMKKGEQIVIDKSKLIDALPYGTFESIYNNQNTFITNRESELKYQIDTTMESNYVDTKKYNHGCIWAMIESYQPEITDSSDVTENGYGVIYQTMTGEYEDTKGIYYPNLNEMYLDVQGDCDWSNGLIYEGAATITYSFEDFPGIKTLEDVDFGKEVMLSYGSAKYADVSAYNPETDEYEPIFTESSILSGEDLKKYVSGNILILRYTSDSMYECYMPRIVARGDE